VSEESGGPIARWRTQSDQQGVDRLHRAGALRAAATGHMERAAEEASFIEDAELRQETIEAIENALNTR
jgi:hypothetical protein